MNNRLSKGVRLLLDILSSLSAAIQRTGEHLYKLPKELPTPGLSSRTAAPARLPKTTFLDSDPELLSLHIYEITTVFEEMERVARRTFWYSLNRVLVVLFLVSGWWQSQSQGSHPGMLFFLVASCSISETAGHGSIKLSDHPHHSQGAALPPDAGWGPSFPQLARDFVVYLRPDLTLFTVCGAGEASD